MILTVQKDIRKEESKIFASTKVAYATKKKDKLAYKDKSFLRFVYVFLTIITIQLIQLNAMYYNVYKIFIQK